MSTSHNPRSGLVNKRDKLECGEGHLFEGPTPFLGSHMKAAVKTCAKLGVTAAPQKTESESVLRAPWDSKEGLGGDVVGV